MVGLVLVSHSRPLAEAVGNLVRRAVNADVPLTCSGGVGDDSGGAGHRCDRNPGSDQPRLFRRRGACPYGHGKRHPERRDGERIVESRATGKGASYFRASCGRRDRRSRPGAAGRFSR